MHDCSVSEEVELEGQPQVLAVAVLLWRAGESNLAGADSGGVAVSCSMGIRSSFGGWRKDTQTTVEAGPPA